MSTQGNGNGWRTWLLTILTTLFVGLATYELTRDYSQTHCPSAETVKEHTIAINCIRESLWELKADIKVIRAKVEEK